MGSRMAQAERLPDVTLEPDRAGPVVCPRRAVLWERRSLAWRPLVNGNEKLEPMVETVALVRRTDGGTLYSSELDAETPYFLEVREGPASKIPNGTLGALVTRLDLDGHELHDRHDAEIVRYGEAPDEVLVVAETSIESAAYRVTRLEVL